MKAPTLSKWGKFNTHSDPELTKALNATLRWRDDFRHPKCKPRWITFCGVTGTGKTLLAKQLWEIASRESDWQRCDFCHSSVYWPKLIKDLRAQERYDERRDMERWPVLFLDDIGAERDTTGFAADELSSLLGCRERKWTIITSNLSLSGIAKVDPRIADRLLRDGSSVVQINTISYALRKNT